MKKILFYIGAMGILFASCTSNGKSGSENSEIVIRESDLLAVELDNPPTEVDSLAQGPFYKYALCKRMDDNGGYEEYRLIMNLYEPNIPNENGTMTYGRLSLFVKTPENIEGVRIAQRSIEQVYQVGELSAEIEMSSTGEKPVYFRGYLTYDTIAHTYQLKMDAPSQLEDLMKNVLVLQ